MEQVAIFEVLRRRAWMIVGICLVAAASGYAFSYLVSERYLASALVLVRPQQPIQMDDRNLDTNLFDFPMTQSMLAETPGKTYIEIIRSPVLIGKVVVGLNLDARQRQSRGFLAKFIPAYLSEDLEEYLKNTVQLLKYGRVIELSPFAKAVKEVQDNLTLHATDDTYVFYISYAGKNPQVAAETVNRLTNSFIDYMANIRLAEAQHVRDSLQIKLEQSRRQLVDARESLESSEHSLATLRELKLREADVEAAQIAYAAVAKDFKQADVNLAYPLPEVRLVSKAAPPSQPSSPVRVKFAAISLIAGLLLGIGLALLLEATNRRVRSVADIENFVGIKVLAIIPHLSSRRWRDAAS
jgi:uncharacterized protein involved in exopolysaccharide biosynthesis